MRVVVPFAAEAPKTRLEDVLDAEERGAFAAAMLVDVLGAVRGAGGVPEVLATAPVDVDAPVTVDDRPLTAAVNGVLEGADGPVAVVAADLAIATPEAVRRLFGAGAGGASGGDDYADGDAAAGVAIAPGRAGGTNALVVRHPEFRVDYHGASYLDHLRIAREVGAEVAVVDSHRLATDVDTRADLVEVLLHGEGRAREWLEDVGFELAVEGGRVDVRRN